MAPSIPAPAGLPEEGPTTPVGNVDRDTASAVEVTQEYWNDIFTGWDVSWIGPSLWSGDGFYDSASSTPGPTCRAPAPPMNAFYCAKGVGLGFVAWDRQLMESGYSGIGDSFVYFVVAHEFAHVAQERFIADGEAPAVLIQTELQADCLAGATLAGAVKRGYLTLAVGDTDELLRSLQAAGDDHPWLGPDDHGSPAQRVGWFRAGFNGDIESCLGNADGSPPGS